MSTQMTLDEMDAAMAAPCANTQCAQPADKCKCNDAQEVKMTQKQTIQKLQTVAYKLDLTVSIRKNSYGEYESRVREYGTRRILLDYFADTFEDAVQTISSVLADAQKEEQAYEQEQDRAYQMELQSTLHNFASLFSRVGCTLMMLDHTVRMISPRTGTHTLNMTRGVRPVSDLVAHACGFIEQQTHRA